MKSCTRCGRIPSHPKHQCPAREATCHKCAKKGHQAFCRFKNTVGEVFSDSDSDIDQGFLRVIEDDSSHFIDAVQEVHGNSWHVSLHINDATVQFKIEM